MDKVNLVQIHNAGGYGSEFDYDSELEARRARRRDLDEQRKNARTKLPKAKEVTEEYNKEEGRIQRYHVLSLDAYSRHKKFINDYMLYYSGTAQQFTRDSSRDKRDIDVIRENHKFLWDEGDEDAEDSWEKRLAKKYYDKLFKEYCITDLSRYKENKFAMRWRIEKEVVAGKGQFVCGNKKCEDKEGLRSWEVNFGYVEQEEKKNALVKLRLCPACSHKLNYYHKKREIKSSKRKRKSGASEKDESSKKVKLDKSGSEAGERDERESEGASKETLSADGTTASTSTSPDDPSNPWSGPAVILEEKSQEEEFDDYFEDMFL